MTYDPVDADADGTVEADVKNQTTISGELSVTDSGEVISTVHIGPTDDFAARIDNNGGYTKYVVHGTHVLGAGPGYRVTDDGVHIHLTDGAELKLADGAIAAGDSNKTMLAVGDSSGTNVTDFKLSGPGHVDGNRANNADEVNNPLIKLFDADSSTLEDLTIRDVPCRVLQHQAGHSLRIEGCTVRNFGEGVLWETPDARIHDNTFRNSHQQDALEPTPGGDYFTISGNTIFDINQSGIDCFGGTNGTIVGNTIRLCYNPGISITNEASGVTIGNNTLVDIDPNQQDYGAIRMEGGDDITAEGNVAVATGAVARGQTGIKVLGGCEDPTIDDNTCIGWLTQGIAIDAIDGGTVTDNTCKNNNQGGANIAGGIQIGSNSAADNLTITDNICTDTQAAKTQEYGIIAQAGDGHTINENDLRGNNSKPVRFFGYAPTSVSFADNIGNIDFGELGTGSTLNGMGTETANAETPTAATWTTGDRVDFTDSGDGSGNGVYLLLPDGTWSQVGAT